MSKRHMSLVATPVLLIFAAWSATTARAGTMIIDDAVFAHDFEQASGSTLVALKGPDATIHSPTIVRSGVDPKSASEYHITPTYAGNRVGEYVNTNTRLTAPTSSLSYTTFYNARGDNGGDYANSTSTAVFLGSIDYSQPGCDFAFRSTRLKPDDTGLQDDRVLRIHCWNNADELAIASSTAPIPDQDSAWHQAGFVYQGGATDGTVTFYYDGQQLGDPVTLAGMPQLPEMQAPWTLIEDYDPNISVSGDEFYDNGFYDEAALWTRALSAGEMHALYTDGIKAVPEPSTLVLLGIGAIMCGAAVWRRAQRTA